MILNRMRFQRRFMEEENGGEGSGGGATDPFTGIEEEVKIKLQQNGIKDLSGLVKNWQDAQSHIGNSIRVPSDDAGEEDRRKFYEKLQKHAPNLIPAPDPDKPETLEQVLKALGKPDDKSGYELPENADFTPSDDFVAELQELAADSSLTKSQFEKLASKLVEKEVQRSESISAAQQAEIDKLKKDWGSAYDDRLNKAAKMMELTGAPAELIGMVKDGKAAADVTQWFYAMAESYKGEGMNAAGDQGDSSVITPQEAESRIQEMLNNRNHAYWDSSHPDHGKALQKMIELAKYADPKASTDLRDLKRSVSFDE